MSARARFRRDQRGGVTLIVAFLLPVILACGALAIDVGSVFLAARKLQGVADLAAISAANNLSSASAAAQATAASNSWDSPITVAVTTGDYQSNSAIPVAQRYLAGASTVNAAQVMLTAQADLFFAAPLIGRSQWTLIRKATATQAALASFSIGTRAVSLQGGAANAILSALTGSTVSLSVADYNALASANVDLLSFAKALQTKTSLQGDSFNSVLSTNISTGAALKLLANQLPRQDAAAAAALNNLATAAAGQGQINLSQLLNLGPYGQQDHAWDTSGTAVQIDALDLANGMLMLAEGGRQVQLNLAGLIPGVGGVTAWLAIGQRPANSPWLTVDDQGATTISTVQARLYLDTSLTPAAGLLASDGLLAVNVPILVDVASAQAKLSNLNCAAPVASQSATLLVQPSLGHVSLAAIDTAKLSDFSHPLTETPAVLAQILLIEVQAQARVDIGGLAWQPVSFTQSDVAAQTVKTVTTQDITQATVSSLLASLNVTVSVAGLNLGLGGGPVISEVSSTLGAVTPSLDSLVNGLTALLGVGLGEADLKMNGLRCGQAALVA